MTRPARASWVALALALVAGCGDDSDSVPHEQPLIVVHLRDVVDAEGEGARTIALESLGATTITVYLDGAVRVIEASVEGGSTPELARADDSVMADAFAAWSAGSWARPRAYDDDHLTLRVPAGAASITLWARGAPPPKARVERSLAWTDAALLDDPSRVGLARVLAAASGDGHGGVLLDRWFRRFATTAHSERALPAQMMDDLAGQYGADPSTWPLDELPFKVTGVHNRLDLAPRGGGCGELRVSIASTDATYSPLHLLFLFRQEPAADDVAPDGEVHCLGAARRWARLSAMDGQAFVDGATQLLDAGLVHDRFLLAESVELTVSPWEWRQWKPVGPDELDNPALFQTLAVPALNAAGPLRDDFLAFVKDNAATLDRREQPIPAAYRAQSARLPPGVPAEPLDLTGLDPQTLAAFPDLAFQLQIVGCPTCHTHNAEFVQTNVDRTFSDFYTAELDARALRLDAMARGDETPTPPFGPLQDIVAP